MIQQFSRNNVVFVHLSVRLREKPQLFFLSSHFYVMNDDNNNILRLTGKIRKPYTIRNRCYQVRGECSYLMVRKLNLLYGQFRDRCHIVTCFQTRRIIYFSADFFILYFFNCAKNV